jgi:hypothetical protein
MSSPPATQHRSVEQDIFLDLDLDIEKMAEEKKETQVNGATLSSSTTKREAVNGATLSSSTTKREAPAWRSMDDVGALQFGSRSKLR